MEQETQNRKNEAAQEQTYHRMLEAPVRGLVCRLAVPAIFSMLITNFYNMADTFFVGRLDTSAVAAVGASVSLMWVIQAFGYFFGQGSGTYISREMGSHRYENARIMAVTGFYTSFLIGVLMIVVGLLFLEPICLLLGATDTMLPHMIDYVRYILFGAPFMISSIVLNNQLRYQGNAVYGMLGIIAGAVINVGLDPLLMFTFDLGVSGAAIATALGQFASWIVLFIGTNRASGNIRMRPADFRPSLHLYREVLRGGMPSLARNLVLSLSVASLTYAASPFSDAAVAAMSIVSRIQQFSNSALIGLGQGFQPVCGFNYGAGRFKRVHEAFWFCVHISSILLVLLCAAAIVFAEPLMTLFRDDALVIEIGSLALIIHSITFPLAAMNVMSNMLMQTIGCTGRATLLASVRQGIAFVPLVLILPRLLGITGIQIAQPIADAVAFVMSLVLTYRVLKNMKNGDPAF